MPTSGSKPSIVFFGSGPVAAKSLKLLAKNFEIEAVITKPRAPHHRGEVPVLDEAEKLKLPVHTASNRTELDELFRHHPVKSHLGILIDFGIIVSQRVIDYFPLGIINSHFSILPEWRGADPITFAILSGQKQTGVSLMLLVEKMDEGPLLAFGSLDLPPDITTPLLTTHLIYLSDALLKAEVPQYLAGKRQGAPQTITDRAVSYSRKLTKEDGVIDWKKPAEQIEREIRAFIEWPKSRTTLFDKEVIITAAGVRKQEAGDKKRANGEVYETDDGQLVVQTGQDLLVIERLKPAGKNEMSVAEFRRGYLR